MPPSSPPPPQPPPSSPPETLSNAFWRNGFDLGRVLGFGAFGKVYRARKVSEMEYKFAVKVIKYKNEEVLQEARSEYACNELGSYHKNVVRVENFFEFSLAGTSKQYGVLVLELCHHRAQHLGAVRGARRERTTEGCVILFVRVDTLVRTHTQVT